MKRITVVLVLLITLLAFGFLVYNYKVYSNYQEKIAHKKKTITYFEEKIKQCDKDIADKKQVYEEIKTSNNEKIEEYEKWKARVEKIEKLLS